MNHELITHLAKEKIQQLQAQATIEQELRSRQHSLRQGNLLAPTKHKPWQVALEKKEEPMT